MNRQLNVFPLPLQMAAPLWGTLIQKQQQQPVSSTPHGLHSREEGWSLSPAIGALLPGHCPCMNAHSVVPGPISLVSTSARIPRWLWWILFTIFMSLDHHHPGGFKTHKDGSNESLASLARTCHHQSFCPWINPSALWADSQPVLGLVTHSWNLDSEHSLSQ